MLLVDGAIFTELVPEVGLLGCFGQHLLQQPPVAPALGGQALVDGRLAGRTTERLEPKSFRLGGAAVDLRDALLYRSALNDDEVTALQSGRIDAFLWETNETSASGEPTNTKEWTAKNRPATLLFTETYLAGASSILALK